MNSDKPEHPSKSVEAQVHKVRHTLTNLPTAMEKKSAQKGTLPKLKLKIQVNQSRKEVKVTNFAGIVPPTKLFQHNAFMFGDFYQDTLPTEH